jgi:hypothetical protein
MTAHHHGSGEELPKDAARMRAIGGRILQEQQQQQQQQRLLLQTPDALAVLLDPQPALLRRLAVKLPGLAKSKSAGGVGGSSRGGVAADAADAAVSSGGGSSSSSSAVISRRPEDMAGHHGFTSVVKSPLGTAGSVAFRYLDPHRFWWSFEAQAGCDLGVDMSVIATGNARASRCSKPALHGGGALPRGCSYRGLRGEPSAVPAVTTAVQYGSAAFQPGSTATFSNNARQWDQDSAKTAHIMEEAINLPTEQLPSVELTAPSERPGSMQQWSAWRHTCIPGDVVRMMGGRVAQADPNMVQHYQVRVLAVILCSVVITHELLFWLVWEEQGSVAAGSGRGENGTTNAYALFLKLISHASSLVLPSSACLYCLLAVKCVFHFQPANQPTCFALHYPLSTGLVVSAAAAPQCTAG